MNLYLLGQIQFTKKFHLLPLANATKWSLQAPFLSSHLEGNAHGMEETASNLM